MNASWKRRGNRISSRQWAAAWLTGLLLLGILVPTWAADTKQATGTAPPHHEVLSHTRGGVYFVAKPLKARYDQLLDRLSSLKAEIDSAHISGPDAQQQLRVVEDGLLQLRKEIDAQKVLVRPVKVVTQTETTTFSLGPERLLIITADSVRVLGWDGPDVKCVIEKTVLAPDAQPADEHLRALRVVHRHGPAPNTVGKTEQEVEAEEKAYLASPAGQKLSPASHAARQALIRSIVASHAPYRAFQGKAVDTLEIEGLSFEQGNRSITVAANSEGGGRSLGSDWQRHAALTVYVPACRKVALRGCLVALEVKGLAAALLVTRDGSRDRDYTGSFQIHDLRGPLHVINVPVQLIEHVHGDVSLTGTVEFANTGTHHESGWRTAYAPAPRECVCRDVSGDLTAQLGRVNLKLEDIAGCVNVRNDFGDTAFIATGPLPAMAQRIVSEAGRVEVVLTKQSFGSLPLLALTNHGKVSTNAAQQVLEDLHFTMPDHATAQLHDWRGMASKAANQGPEIFWTRSERPGLALVDRERSAGLDLISRSGAVVVTVRN